MSISTKLKMKHKFNNTAAIVTIFTLAAILFLLNYNASYNSGNNSSDDSSDDLIEPAIEQLAPLTYKLITATKNVSTPSAEIMGMIDNNILDRKNNVLLTAVANSGMTNYTLNWIESLKRCNIDKFLVFAIDDKLVETLSEAGYGDKVVTIPEDWFHVPVSKNLMSWDDLNTYLPMTHSKSLVVERLLYQNITVWFSDVDIVFLSPHIYDFLLHKLNIRKTTHAVFQQRGVKDNNDINSGFFLMKPTDLTKHIISESISIQDDGEYAKKHHITQQRAINRVIESLNIDFYTSPLVMLEMELFPVGNVYFDHNIPMKYGLQPMMVHGNFRDGEEKELALRKAGLWYI
ncbi:unnamed protein product [Umbelopsis ramanniana]